MKYRMLDPRLIGALALITLACQASAQTRRPREARSENKRFVLEIQAARRSVAPVAESRPADQQATTAERAAPRPGGCRATLSERNEDRRSTRRWSETLVNEVSPVRAFVRDDGRFVVTVDEVRRGGAAHAVVVYDEHGKLKCEFSLRDLLNARDWREVRTRGNAIEWLRGARLEFQRSEPRFEITLRWNTRIEIDLESGELVGGPRQASDADIPDAARAALTGNADDRSVDTNADPEDATELDELLARLEQDDALTPDEAQRLLELATADGVELSDEMHASIEAALLQSADASADDDIASQAANMFAMVTGVPFDADALRAAEDEPAELRAQLETLLAQRNENGAIAQAILESDSFRQSLAEALSHFVGESLLRTTAAGNSYDAGLAVPQPDPAHPVNYIEWMKSLSAVEGTPAAPVYQQAIDAFVPFEGDQTLYDAALSGDANALASESIQAWLAANRGAMDSVFAATQLEYRGMPIQATDGRMFNILLPHLASMRNLSKVMVAQGHALEASGDPQQATDYFLKTVRAGAQSSQGPTLIENLVGVAQQALGSEALLDSYAKPGASQLDFVKLARDLERDYAPVRPTSETIQAERAMLLDIVQSAYEVDEESGEVVVSNQGTADLLSAFNATGSGDADQGLQRALIYRQLAQSGFASTAQSVNEHYDRITTATRAPFREGREQLHALENEINQPSFRVANPLLSTMLPSLSRATEMNVRSESRRRATALVTNLMAYRQQNGSFPDSLDALGERSFVVDPLTGERFAYRRNGDDFSLYSLGVNGTDDGAIHDPKGRENDFVYWPRPAKNP